MQDRELEEIRRREEALEREIEEMKREYQEELKREEEEENYLEKKIQNVLAEARQVEEASDDSPLSSSRCVYSFSLFHFMDTHLKCTVFTCVSRALV